MLLNYVFDCVDHTVNFNFYVVFFFFFFFLYFTLCLENYIDWELICTIVDVLSIHDNCLTSTKKHK